MYGGNETIGLGLELYTVDNIVKAHAAMKTAKIFSVLKIQKYSVKVFRHFSPIILAKNGELSVKQSIKIILPQD
jgi:hypothetical protein